MLTLPPRAGERPVLMALACFWPAGENGAAVTVLAGLGPAGARADCDGVMLAEDVMDVTGMAEYSPEWAQD